jgi:hypothetical protein
MYLHAKYLIHVYNYSQIISIKQYVRYGKLLNEQMSSVVPAELSHFESY